MTKYVGCVTWSPGRGFKKAFSAKLPHSYVPFVAIKVDCCSRTPLSLFSYVSGQLNNGTSFRGMAISLAKDCKVTACRFVCFGLLWFY
jgi:hypothetical protein